MKKRETSNNIINILNKGEKISLWERLFSKRNIDLTRTSLDEIRKIRNKVMHNKEISDIEFCKYRNLLKQYIKKLDIAIADFDNRKDLRETDLENVLSSFARIIQTSGINERITKAVSPVLSEISKSLRETIIKNFPKSIKPLEITMPNLDRIIHFDNESLNNVINERIKKIYR